MTSRASRLTLAFLIFSVLGGCAVAPSEISLGIANRYDEDTYCTDGLEASLELEGNRVETGLLAPEESGGDDLFVPEGAGPGAILKTEARCYRDGQEVGYVLVEKPYRADNIPTVNIIPPPAEGSNDYIGCTQPTEARGVKLCVSSSLYG